MNNKSKNKSSSLRLGYENIPKLIFEFSIPAIGSILFNSLYNIIDTAFLGQVMPDGSGVAVATLALPLSRILIALTLFAGQGGNALAAIYLGKKKYDYVHKIIGNTFILLTFFSFVSMIVGIFFVDYILIIIGTPESLMTQTRSFVQILLVFFFFHAFSMGLNNFLRTAGKPFFAFWTMGIGTIVCIVLNAIFVLILDYGVIGSAFATVIGEGSGCLFIFPYLIFSKNSQIKLKLKACIPNFLIIKKILFMGITALVTNIASSAISIVFNWVVRYYGSMSDIGVTGAFASIGVAQKIIILCALTIAGISIGVQPIFGFNFGAKKFDRVIKTLKFSILYGMATGLFWMLILLLFSYPIISLFGINNDIVDYTVYVLRVGVIFFPIQGFQIIGGDYFQSIGKPLKSAIFELTRQLILLIPMYIVLPIIFTSFGFTSNPLDGIAWAVSLSDLFAGIITFFFIKNEFANLRIKLK